MVKARGNLENRRPSENNIKDLKLIAAHELSERLTDGQAKEVAEEIYSYKMDERDDFYRVPTERLRRIVDKVKYPREQSSRSYWDPKTSKRYRK